MNTRVFLLYLAATLLALKALAHAERPSSDEVALRLGVDAWVNNRAVVAPAQVSASLKPLYRSDAVATELLSGTLKTAQGWADYVALWQPFFSSVSSFHVKPANDLKISVQGDRAVTGFSFASQGAYKDGRPLTCAAAVNLTWARTEGVWQIAQEELRPLDPSLALESSRATTQR